MQEGIIERAVERLFEGLRARSENAGRVDGVGLKTA